MTARRLTEGEIREASSCFTNHLDYAAVRIHDTKWFFLQPDTIAMAPRGAVHFPPTCCRPDFSVDPDLMAWLVHELTHCWQHQAGQWVMLRGIYERTYEYGTLTERSYFDRFNIEQQASIVEDLYRLSKGMKTRRGSGTLSAYQAVVPMTRPR